MTKMEIDNLYKNNVKLIQKVVWDFIKKYQLPISEFDEYLCQANLFFMIAVSSHDIDIAKFSTWLQIQLETRLLMQYRIDKREWEKIHFPHERDVQIFTDVQPPILWIDELTEDAKTLITLICKGELDCLIYDENNGLERGRKRYVYRFLLEWGWKRLRIRRCLESIKKALVEVSK